MNVEHGDIVRTPRHERAVVMFVWDGRTAMIEYGPHIEREDGVYARWATVALDEVTVIKSREEGRG
jgi:hypothetical protein